MTNAISPIAHALRILVVIPAYNHAPTLRAVVEKALAIHPDVLVVDDGSTDAPFSVLSGLPVFLERHRTNRGKGAAIRTAAKRAGMEGFTHIITLDADGQHDPADIRLFLPLIEQEPDAIIVGARDFDTENIPGSSRFGRKFSNFWLRVQTGVILSDVQSGFRAYPLAVLDTLNLKQDRYAFEVEVLAQAAWAGFPLRDVDISVYYPKPEERVSHFDKFRDNVRISLLNTRLTARSFLPVPHRQYCRDASSGDISALHPLESIRLLLLQNNTSSMLGWSTALGIVIGALPIFGLHCIAIVLVLGYLRLSKVTGLASQTVCIPPFVPAICIEVGHYLRFGEFLTDISLQTLGYEAVQRLYEWFLGSLIVGPVLGLVAGLFVHAAAKSIQKSLASCAGKNA